MYIHMCMFMYMCLWTWSTYVFRWVLGCHKLSFPCMWCICIYIYMYTAHIKCHDLSVGHTSSTIHWATQPNIYIPVYTYMYKRIYSHMHIWYIYTVCILNVCSTHSKQLQYRYTTRNIQDFHMCGALGYIQLKYTGLSYITIQLQYARLSYVWCTCTQ